MNRPLFLKLFYVLVAVLISSCVAQKKYDELLAEKVKLESDLATTEEDLAAAQTKLEQLEEKVNNLAKDTSDLGNDVREKGKMLNELAKEHQQLEKYYNNLLNNSGKLNRDLAAQQERLLALKETLEQSKQNNEQLSKDLEAREQKVRELETVLKNKDKAVRALKDKITQALLNFNKSDLTVEERNGKIYVSLAEKLLFKSGSIEVDPQGINALQQLAQAIKNQDDINIMVEGHTDNVPISRASKYMNDNWDLSVMRATSITRILINAGLAPSQVTAAGKGEHSPLTTNDSTEGKKKNRRTEIIITPDLGELLKILNTN